MSRDQVDAELKRHLAEVQKQEAARILAKNEAARLAAEQAAEQARQDAAQRMKELEG